MSKGFQPSICVIGAGASGIISGYQIKNKLKGYKNFTIYEKEYAVGGTWYVNRYPGVACDVMSHLYSFSFEHNPDWSQSFSPGPEIWRYMEATAHKHGLYPHIKFGHEYRGAKWNEDDSVWEVSFVVHSPTDSKPTPLTVRANILISGGGGLHVPKLPDYPGWETFKGTIAHSAEWPRMEVDFKGKNVGVIGNGASGVQIVETIAPHAAKLTVYQRTPNWHPPKPMFEYSSFQKFLFRYVPFLTTIYRFLIFLRNDGTFSFLKTGSLLQRLVKWAVLKYLNAVVKDPELRKAITPTYDFGMKRVLPQSTYLQDLQRPTTELVHKEKIVSIGEEGIYTEKDGKKVLRKHDIIIAATGFDTTPSAGGAKIIGRGGIERGEKWRQLTGEKELAVHYKTVTTSGFPNYFFLLGPNAGIGHISAIYIIECQVDLVMTIVDQMIRNGIKTVDVKEDVQWEYSTRIWNDLKKTVWCGGTGKSWYNPTGRTDGKISTMWPYTAYQLQRETRSADLVRDFNLQSVDGKPVTKVSTGSFGGLTYMLAAATVAAVALKSQGAI